MDLDRLARTIAESLGRHQTRGLVDDATGLADVVVHGRVNLLAMADDLRAELVRELKPARKSWTPWFACHVADQRRGRRRERDRERLVRQIENAATSVDEAIARLKLRELDTQADT